MTIPGDSRRSTEQPNSGEVWPTDLKGWPLWDAEARGAGADAEVRVVLAAVATFLVAVEASSPETGRLACAALEQELAAHMTRQAEAMRRSSYPLAAGHQSAHDRLRTELGPLLHQLGDAAAPCEDRRMVAAGVATRLVAHVAAYDTGLAAYLKGLGEG